jgi:modulator of FtsH protease
MFDCKGKARKREPGGMAFQIPAHANRMQTAIPAQSLLGQVLGIVAVGMAISGLAAYLLPNIPPIAGLIAMLAGFGALIGIHMTRANETLSLLLFYLFALLEGIGIAPTIHNYVTTVGPDVVYDAALTTALGMAVLGGVVYITGLDLRRFQGWFMGALIALVLVGLVSLFFHFVSPTVYSWATLVIFAGLTLIDFARLRAGGDGLTPVQMAVQIYLDALNIFMALLQIFGGRRRD